MNRINEARKANTQCRLLGISLSATPQGLVIEGSKHVISDELVAGLREYKAELLEMLSSPAPVYETPVKPDENRGLGYGDKGDTDQIDAWQLDEPLDWDALPEPIECPNCGGIDAWWNVLGAWRCATCDPPTASHRWLERTERLRRKHRRQHQFPESSSVYLGEQEPCK